MNIAAFNCEQLRYAVPMPREAPVTMAVWL
jgi:hypothetical protein